MSFSRTNKNTSGKSGTAVDHLAFNAPLRATFSRANNVLIPKAVRVIRNSLILLLIILWTIENRIFNYWNESNIKPRPKVILEMTCLLRCLLKTCTLGESFRTMGERK